MKESYGEGVATHPGPESCSVGRKGDGEALTGGRAGQVLSREIHGLGVPTPLRKAEGNIGGSVIASCRRTPRGQ